jgi:hypothetical protein
LKVVRDNKGKEIHKGKPGALNIEYGRKEE